MKERLTGAIILVALIVLLVPEFLRGPVKSAPRTVAASAEEPPLRSYTINLGDDSQARGATAQPQASAPQAATTPPAVHASPPAASPGATETAGGWMVQLGSFASRPNAERLAQQLKGQGFAASVSQGTSGRHLYRVRVGPAHDKAAATQLQGKLKAAGHTGAVVPR